MEIGLLGPLRIDGDGVTLQRRDQVVLSALAVRSGEVMSADQLAEAVWGEEPPPSWPKIVQGCVLRLRRTLGHEAIETTSGGYRLVAGGDELDTERFERLVERGGVLAVGGDSERAAIAYDRALALWRGAPFDVLDGWPPGQIEVARLEELRRSAEERWLDARLAIGEHSDVVATAEAKVAEEPLREHRWATLALALYRCGRQADALRSLRHARHVLVEQLGIEPGAELVELEAAILRQDESLAAQREPPAAAEHCPYKGLAPYGVEDTEAFFGREGEVAACLGRLRSSPLLVVTGPSGCGKSSLVRAGLIPALMRAGRAVAVCVPGSDPDAAMTAALSSVDSTPVLVVDQFEELFTLDDGGTRGGAFCRRLAEYAATCAEVVVVVRADHVASLVADAEFAALAEQGLHLVPPLVGDALREAIEGPAALAGLRLEAGLVDLLVRDTEGEPGALPLLSHALAETWLRRDGRVLTVAGYRATGEIRGAVARSADRLYESLPAEQRQKLRSVMLRLVSQGGDGEPVRSRVATSSLSGDADRERVLGLLVRARLVTSEEETVELAHEALARAWPRLRSWLDEDAAGHRTLRHLAAAAEGWESLGRPQSELYRGARLESVVEWRAATSPDLTPREETFLEASEAEAESERRQLVEHARRQARQNRRLRLAIGAVGLLLVAALLGGLLAYQQRRTAQAGGRQAAMSALISNGSALRDNHRDVAALLAVEAYRLAPSAATESTLFGTFTGAPGAAQAVHTDLSLGGSVVFLGTDRVAVAGSLGAVDVFDLTTGERVRLDPIAEEDDAPDSFAQLAASADGRYLLVVWRPGRPTPRSLYSRLTVWDVDRGERLFDPLRIPYVSGSVSISTDGGLIVVGGGYWGHVQIRDGATGRLLHDLERLPRPGGDGPLSTVTAAVAFTPDGDLAVGSQVGPIRIVDPLTGAELRRLDAPQETSNEYIFFVGGGSELVALGRLGVIGFDLASGERLWPEPYPMEKYCPTWAYADRLRGLLCQEEFSGAVDVYDIASGLELGKRFDAQLGGVCGLAVSPDGTRLAEVASCDGDATIVVWRLDGGGPISELVVDTPGEHYVRGFGADADRDTLVAEYAGEGAGDLVTHVVDAATGSLVAELPGTQELVPTDDPRRALAYFPEDGMVSWYDVEQRVRVGTGVEIADFAYLAAGDGRVVALSGADSGMILRGVDLDTGTVVPPTIDGAGEFMMWHVALGQGALYTVAEPLRGPLSELQRRDPESGDVVVSAPGYTNVATRTGILVASTPGGVIDQLDPVSLEPMGAPFPTINSLVHTMTIDETGRRLLVLGEDETLRIFDVATRTPLGDAIDLSYDDSLREVSRYVDLEAAGAVLRDDGLQAAVDTVQGIVVWDLDPEQWVEAACGLAGRNLTHDEWDQYVGDLAPYRTTCPEYAEA
jgi:DNA-binding SARP family transcriptional activator/WD40 repeat protein